MAPLGPVKRPTARAVLFDLDGTLVETVPAFYRAYMAELATWLGGGDAAAAVMSATDEVRRGSGGGAPVGRRILEGIGRRLGVDAEGLRASFAEFYRVRYPSLRQHVHPIPGAEALLAAASSGGARVCLASDPVFPAAQLAARLRWGGIDPAALDRLPGCDDLRAVKPRRAYYLELAAQLAVEPASCLLVGNDPERDGAALDVGMSVFLLAGPQHAVADRPVARAAVPAGAASGGTGAGAEYVARFITGR